MGISKIALAGCEGTGKSTLAEEVGRELDLAVIPEFAREVANSIGFKDIRKMTPWQFHEFQIKILDLKLAEEAKYDRFVADRSTADNAAYYLRWCAAEIPSEMSMGYIEKCIEHLKTYDLVVFVPWDSIPLENDNFRDVRPYYRYEIHCLILGILQDNRIPYMTLSDRDLASRISIIKNLFMENL